MGQAQTGEREKEKKTACGSSRSIPTRTLSRSVMPPRARARALAAHHRTGAPVPACAGSRAPAACPRQDAAVDGGRAAGRPGGEDAPARVRGRGAAGVDRLKVCARARARALRMRPHALAHAARGCTPMRACACSPPARLRACTCARVCKHHSSPCVRAHTRWASRPGSRRCSWCLSVRDDPTWRPRERLRERQSVHKVLNDRRVGTSGTPCARQLPRAQCTRQRLGLYANVCGRRPESEKKTAKKRNQNLVRSHKIEVPYAVPACVRTPARACTSLYAYVYAYAYAYARVYAYTHTHLRLLTEY